MKNWNKNSKAPYNQRTKDICILPTKGLEKYVYNEIIDNLSLEKILSLWNSKEYYSCNWWSTYALKLKISKKN